ncbi:Zn-dependent oligopeptidase [Archangium sp. Cb G35]|nr:Zn-dependent oligopeptidase [Archangium sp. Cb G35]
MGSSRSARVTPGGARPAAKLMKDLLGRPYGFEACRAYMDEQ